MEWAPLSNLEASVSERRKPEKSQTSSLSFCFLSIRNYHSLYSATLETLCSLSLEKEAYDGLK